MQRNYRRIFMTLLLVLIFCAVSVANPKYLTCSNCQAQNDPDNLYCHACGEALDDELAARENQRQTLKKLVNAFSSARVEPTRLFNIPTADILASRDISLIGGGAFGNSYSNSLLGTVGIGLGGVAEVEFSTTGLVNNIASGTPTVATSAFKLQLIPEGGYGWVWLPKIAIAMRSTASWKGIHSDERVLRANEWYTDGISHISYDTRFTVLYGVMTISAHRVNLHGGANLTDVRVKDAEIYKNWESSDSDPNEKQKVMYGGFAGIDIEVNPQTKLMVETETLSKWTYNHEEGTIDVNQDYLLIGGIRFFFRNWLSIDTGIWYQGNYRGIADTQMKLGLNIFIPGKRIESLKDIF